MQLLADRIVFEKRRTRHTQINGKEKKNGSLNQTYLHFLPDFSVSDRSTLAWAVFPEPSIPTKQTIRITGESSASSCFSVYHSEDQQTQDRLRSASIILLRGSFLCYEVRYLPQIVFRVFEVSRSLPPRLCCWRFDEGYALCTKLFIGFVCVLDKHCE